jgi:hypothetical protein
MFWLIIRAVKSQYIICTDTRYSEDYYSIDSNPVKEKQRKTKKNKQKKTVNSNFFFLTTNERRTERGKIRFCFTYVLCLVFVSHVRLPCLCFLFLACLLSPSFLFPFLYYNFFFFVFLFRLFSNINMSYGYVLF